MQHALECVLYLLLPLDVNLGTESTVEVWRCLRSGEEIETQFFFLLPFIAVDVLLLITSQSSKMNYFLHFCQCAV